MSTVISRRSPRELTSLPDILDALASLENEESEVSSALAGLLASTKDIDSAMKDLQSLSPDIDELKAESGLLVKKVSSTAGTANRVGGRVRSLDEQMRRVREASERVGQVIELKVRSNTLY